MPTDAQLAVIRDLSAALSRAGVEHWLTGGWAVDFLHGSVTRPHKDVDLVIRANDAAAAGLALSAAGFDQIDTAFPDERLEFACDGVDVELIFIVRDEAGELVTPGRWVNWPWPPDTLAGPSGRIGDVSCRVVSIAAQIDSKRNYSTHQPRSLRAQDLHDLKLLEALTDRVN